MKDVFCTMIVLVDDDNDDLELFREFLNVRYTGPVVQFKNGHELMQFLSTVAGHQAKVIVLDLNMPIKNGFQALREIKSDITLSAIPVVVLSASSSENDRTQCLQMGCSSFIRKPDSVNAYNKIVGTVISYLDLKASA